MRDRSPRTRETLGTALGGSWVSPRVGYSLKVWCRATTRCRLDLLPASEGNPLRTDPWADAVGDRLCGPARQLWHPFGEGAIQSPESGK